MAGAGAASAVLCIGGSADWLGGGAVGVAYLDVFGTASSLDFYKPTFAFSQDYYLPKQVSAAAAAAPQVGCFVEPRLCGPNYRCG